MTREVMEYDVVIVGGGPSGLATAIKLKQLSADVNVCVLEKGAEIGSHILSGNVFETRALDELIPKEYSYKSQIRYVKDRLGHDKRYGIDSAKIKSDLKKI